MLLDETGLKRSVPAFLLSRHQGMKSGVAWGMKTRLGLGRRLEIVPQFTACPWVCESIRRHTIAQVSQSSFGLWILLMAIGKRDIWWRSVNNGIGVRRRKPFGKVLTVADDALDDLRQDSIIGSARFS